uniref:ribonuclease H n=1 Tax=Knipowitschia caucasica TaxID=637954 RepID=A0AAV2KRL7_KNICA
MDSAVRFGPARVGYGDKVPLGKTPVVQVLQRLSETDSLFHTDVIMDNCFVLKALVDSGSMACTISEQTDSMLQRDFPEIDRKRADEYVIVGCGGQPVMPTAMYDLSVLVYGVKVIVPVLVVPGQSDSMILGSNVLKWLMMQIENGAIDSIQDLPEPQRVQSNTQRTMETPVLKTEEEINKTLMDMGLPEVDITSCEVSLEWKNKLLNLIERYDSTFSRHKMDCGEAKDFVHRIRLMDDKPFRLPYRRVPPCHYEKLRTALNEMEEVGIIKKSQSEYASPLVLVVKPNGDLRICNDFRWLNARTIKDAHPLPHQTDALAALGGNVFFSTMDLTSGFYNVPLHEDDKRFTAFSSPFGLHEYNRMPQGLTNSPATFMRMMMSIFGDKNFTSLLCYLDDLMVFAPSEQIALERLEMVFSRLAANNLKLSPKKCHFLRRSVKFLGHIVCEEGMKTDPSKVQAIGDIREADLMEADGPCQSASIRVESSGALSQLSLSGGDHALPEDHSELAPADAMTYDAAADTQLLPVRTRAGRLINPPARLICEMKEQRVMEKDSSQVVGPVFSFMRFFFPDRQPRWAPLFFC